MRPDRWVSWVAQIYRACREPALRTAGPEDAASLLRLKQRLDRESSFMLLEPGERDTSAEALARHLANVARSQNSVVIVAEIGGELAGYVELAGGSFRRNRATAQVVIGVAAEASGKGIGTGLLRQARDWAATHGLHRLELTVMAHKFVDELYMAALLPGAHPADPA